MTKRCEKCGYFHDKRNCPKCGKINYDYRDSEYHHSVTPYQAEWVSHESYTPPSPSFKSGYDGDFGGGGSSSSWSDCNSSDSSSSSCVTNKFYTGIGSREAPDDILYLMELISSKLESSGYILRSGGADGSDSAFESGVNNPLNKEIYVPWDGFNNRFDGDAGIYLIDDPELLGKCREMVREVHPSFSKLGSGALKLHMRNCFQVLGGRLDTPSKFLICWAPIKGQSITGGTRTAWELGKNNGIKCLNLNDGNVRNMMIDFVKT